MAASHKRERLREAAQFIKQGDNKSAQAIFRELIKADPSDAELWYLYSFAATDKEHQLKSLERVLAIAPDHAKAKERLAQLRGEAPVLPKVGPKPTMPPYALMAGGGLVGLVVVVVLIGVVLSRPQQGEPLTTPTQPPTATFNIVTRKPTDENAVPTETSTAAAVADNPTFVPTLTRPPASVPDTGSTTSDAAVSSLAEFGGGTGRILYGYRAAGQATFQMIDLHDGMSEALTLPDWVNDARWLSNGRQLLVSNSQYYSSCGNEECLGVMSPDDQEAMMFPNLELWGAVYPVLSPAASQIAFLNSYQEIWAINVEGSDLRKLISHSTSRSISGLAWSPNGRFLAYTRDLADDEAEIRLMAADGSDDHVFIPDGRQIAWSPDGTSIAYVVKEPNYQIFVANADGSNARQITFTDDLNKNGASWPAWSPNGQLIAFLAGSDLYVVNVDGSDLTALLDPPQRSSLLARPSWEPLPSEKAGIVVPTVTVTPSPFLSPVPILPPSATPTRSATQWSTVTPVPIATIDRSNFTPQPEITPTRRAFTSSPLTTFGASFGGGTGRILFKAERFPKGNITFHTVDLRDGTVIDTPFARQSAEWLPNGRQLLANNTGLVDATTRAFFSFPREQTFRDVALSPDQQQLAFIGEDWGLWVQNIDGTEARQLVDATSKRVRFGHPNWSPDGRLIAYSSGVESPTREIRVVSPDGSGDRVLVPNALMPAWSPDGRSLAYVAFSEGRPGAIAIADANGQNARQISFNPDASDHAESPAWSPDGNLIAFTQQNKLYVMPADQSQPPVAVASVKMLFLHTPSWEPIPSTAIVTATPTITPSATLTPPPTPRPEDMFTGSKTFTARVLGQLNAPQGAPIGGQYGDAQGNFTLDGTGDLTISPGFIRGDILTEQITGVQWTFAFTARDLEVGRTYESLGNDGRFRVMMISSGDQTCNENRGHFTLEAIDPYITVRFAYYCVGRPDLVLNGVLTFLPR